MRRSSQEGGMKGGGEKHVPSTRVRSSRCTPSPLLLLLLPPAVVVEEEESAEEEPQSLSISSMKTMPVRKGREGGREGGKGGGGGSE